MQNSPPDPLSALDAAIARGLADIKAGRAGSIDEVCDRLVAKYSALVRKPSR
jgi:predicted transcriptional regulator